MLRGGGIHIKGKHTGILIVLFLIVISILMFGNNNDLISFDTIISFMAAVLTAIIACSAYSYIKQKDDHKEQEN